jgi:hypothetical protein
LEIKVTNDTTSQKLAQLLIHIDGAYAPNTLRAYKADMLEFIAYCEKNGVCALPAKPETVAEFLMQTVPQGIQSSTIRRKVPSISAIHHLSSLEDPTKHSEVRIVQRKIYRQLGTRFDQAYPITRALLARLLATCEVGLPGCGKWIRLTSESSEALHQWLSAAKINEGLIFGGVKPSGAITDGLCESRISRIYKARARKAGLSEIVVKSISGHSMRVGGAQDLLNIGRSLPQIMVKGGWVKTDTVMRYVERARSASSLRL